MTKKPCIDCGQPVDPDAFPDFVKTERAENAKRCADCTAIALWQLVMGDWDSTIDGADPYELKGTGV